ncbi:YciI family protein [Frankia sp. CcI49]|uniref:YciI family protein n=1 Tax=Frankia sp. CcI49 TaxID=1745382 RepID=UPI0018EA1038|nr:YciI family protein [Frankia sp. CcI49]
MAAKPDMVADMASLFILDLTYTADLTEVERYMDGHREFLRRNYDAGLFLASGRKEPRTGGIILTAGDRSTIEQIIETDPFQRHGVVSYAITEFFPTTTGPQLAAFRHEI